MAAVAPPPFSHRFGPYYHEHPYPPPFIPGRNPTPPVNHAPSGPHPPPGTAEFDQAAFGTNPQPEPQRAPVNHAPSGPHLPPGTSEFDQAAFGTNPQPEPQQAQQPESQQAQQPQPQQAQQPQPQQAQQPQLQQAQQPQPQQAQQPKPQQAQQPQPQQAQQPKPQQAQQPEPDRARPHRRRDRRVTFGTITEQPQRTTQDAGPRPSRNSTEAPTVTVPQSQPSSTTLEQQREQLLSSLLHHFPPAASIYRLLVNLIDDPQLIQLLIDKLNRPLTQQHFLEIQDAFTIPQEEEEGIIRVLNNPGDPNAATLVTQFVEVILDRPYPTSDRDPASTDGARSCFGRLIPSCVRNRLPCLNRRRRRSTRARASSSAAAAQAAQPSTVHQDGTGTFPAWKLREGPLRNHIVEPFTCTECGTNIPANRTRGTDPQLGTNLHLRCPNPRCRAVFCRGCHRAVTGCQPNCTARHACGLKSCCSEVRAIAIFEYLSVFDEEYLTRIRNFHRGAANAHTHANRLSFLQHAFNPGSRRDPRFRGFISVLKRTLKYVSFWLQPSIPENVPCLVVVYMVAMSFLAEVINAFLARGIDSLAHFRARGYLMHRIVDLLFAWSVDPAGPFYELMEESPLIIVRSPGTRSLMWDPELVFERHFAPRGTPGILDNMRNLWTRIENEVGAERLRDAANEFDPRLYDRGHELSLIRRGP